MKIEIVDDTGAETLVDGPVRGSDYTYATGPLDALEFSDDSIIQLAPRFRSTVRACYNRGNVAVTAKFGAVRQFTSSIAALTWLATHKLTVRRDHTLRITDGSSTLLLKKGALGPIQATPRGVSLELRYTFTFTEAA